MPSKRPPWTPSKCFSSGSSSATMRTRCGLQALNGRPTNAMPCVKCWHDTRTTGGAVGASRLGVKCWFPWGRSKGTTLARAVEYALRRPAPPTDRHLHDSNRQKRSVVKQLLELNYSAYALSTYRI
ncbi:hypothetical protein H310_10238 [Aphanomyces invadans]|uniref:Uncharacterized protein n=1 Tax=Aphanomyces invadans TaxID=157072 RepID=A0A024TRA1_9STRA|nr:hypothetical protein H310_10238 [Aphanomyces invadans]ETV96519.1 hypothetical protein H310_10238 [Aphanomyces invadans]|eukprot:XP_008874782.1 hypothetical protein H310_10238 [Aphanomyces invadans]